MSSSADVRGAATRGAEGESGIPGASRGPRGAAGPPLRHGRDAHPREGLLSLRSTALVALAGLSCALALVACNGDQGTNPVSVPELDSPGLLGATSGSRNYIHVFPSTGTYPYHCTYHSTANHREGGSVIVEAGGPDSAFVSIFQGAFDPATATVKPGGQVRWQNFDDGVHHSVTSD